MRHIFRLVFFGGMAIFALAACSSSSGETSSEITLPPPAAMTPASAGSEVAAEAADLPTRRPQFLNSYADW